MPPRNAIAWETLQLVWRAFCVYAERRLEAAHAGDDPEGCLAREGTEAFHVATTAVGAVCDAKADEYQHVVKLLKGPNVFSHHCATGSCGYKPGSCVAPAAGAFNDFLNKMDGIRKDPALLDALTKHAERKRYELAAYVACWEPTSMYGQVLDVAGEYIYSAETGSRIKVFDMSDEPSYNVLASRSMDARDIMSPDAHTKRLATALMSRSYPEETLMWSPHSQKKKKKSEAEAEEAEEDSSSEESDESDSGTGAATKKRKRPDLQKFWPTEESRGRIENVCNLLSASKAAWDTTTASPFLIHQESGHFVFNTGAVHHRPKETEFNALPMYLSRRFTSFTYDPVRRYSTAGGFAALCAAIKAAHDGHTVDRLFLDGETVGGWGARLPDPAAVGAFNVYTGPLALEKQLEYAMPLIEPTPTGPVFRATALETRACAHPVLEFASLLLKPQVLLSVVPEHGTIIVDHRRVPETNITGTVTERDYTYAIDSSPRTSALFRDTMRTIGAGLHKALRYTFDAFVKAPKAVPEVSKLGVEYAVSPAWRSTSTFDGAALAHWIDAQGVCSDAPIADSQGVADKIVLSNKQACAFVAGRLARFLWRHACEEVELDKEAVLALVQVMRCALQTCFPPLPCVL